jgi:hypothetical protein
MALPVRLTVPVRLLKYHRLNQLMRHLPKLKMRLQPKEPTKHQINL